MDVAKNDVEHEVVENMDCEVVCPEKSGAPVIQAVDRPLRERKAVDRLVNEMKPAKRFVIEPGRGLPLKEIPNVASKLKKKKAHELKLLHKILFGGKQVKVNEFKTHILQFSGFDWNEYTVNQRAKTIERIERQNKEALAGLCDMLDLPGAKHTRKEELVALLLDFLEVPRVEGVTFASDKKQKKHFNVVRVADDNDGKSSDDEDASEQSEDKSEESIEAEYEEESAEDSVDPHTTSGRKKHLEEKESCEASTPVLNDITEPTSEKNLCDSTKQEKGSAGKSLKRKKAAAVTPTKKSGKSSNKEKSTEKKYGRGKPKSGRREYKPTAEQVHQVVCQILDRVDYFTTTFGDILKELEKHFEKDLSTKKSAIKTLIEMELYKRADEADRNGHGGDDNEEGDEEAGTAADATEDAGTTAEAEVPCATAAAPDMADAMNDDAPDVAAIEAVMANAWNEN